MAMATWAHVATTPEGESGCGARLTSGPRVSVGGPSAGVRRRARCGRPVCPTCRCRGVELGLKGFWAD